MISCYSALYNSLYLCCFCLHVLVSSLSVQPYIAIVFASCRYSFSLFIRSFINPNLLFFPAVYFFLSVNYWCIAYFSCLAFSLCLTSLNAVYHEYCFIISADALDKCRKMKQHFAHSNPHKPLYECGVIVRPSVHHLSLRLSFSLCTVVCVTCLCRNSSSTVSGAVL